MVKFNERFFTLVLIGIFACLLLSPALARPKPGDIFREYRSPLNMLRIGERWEWGGSNSGKNFTLNHSVDLGNAIKAEVEIFMVQCHTGTKGLRIAFNDNAYQMFPISDQIPVPQDRYQFREFPCAEIPLSHLRSGSNVYKMRVDADPKPQGVEEGWMQNLIYGIYLRVYYNSSKSHATGQITSPSSGATMGKSPVITASASGNVSRVEFVGLYEDFCWRGDGVYRQWHYAYKASDASLENHLGTDNSSPWSLTWNNSWVPDQAEPMKIAARIVDANGIIYMTQAAENIKLERSNFSVEMCKPYNIPEAWVTRSGVRSADFDVSGDLSKATGARLLVNVWKYEWALDVSINSSRIGAVGEVSNVVTSKTISTSPLRSGKNSISTAEGGHHGVEVNYPGLVVFIQYSAARVLLSNGAVSPAEVSNGGQTSVQFTVDAKNSDGTAVSSVTLDLSELNGSSSQAMTKGSGNTWTADVTVPSGLSIGRKFILITATNSSGSKATSQVSLNITGSSKFIADFESGDLSGWTVGSGAWGIANGALRSGELDENASIWTGQSSWSDVTISADMNLANLLDARVLFRVQDADNYYYFSATGGLLPYSGALYKRVNGVDTKIADALGVLLQERTSHTVKIELSGNSIRILVDGTQVVNTTDNTYSSGYAGFGSHNSPGDFDNFQVDLGGTSDGIRGNAIRFDYTDNVRVYPNPFSTGIRIKCSMGNWEWGVGSLNIYDIKGKLVHSQLVTPNSQLGWDASNQPAGNYMLKVKVGNREQVRKLMLVK
jgi:hypothetical protein